MLLAAFHLLAAAAAAAATTDDDDDDDLWRQAITSTMTAAGCRNSIQRDQLSSTSRVTTLRSSY